MKKRVTEFDVIVEQDEDGMYVAHVPELPGCHTQGETVEEVLSNIREAIELYLEHSKGEEKESMRFVAVHRIRVPSAGAA